MKSRRFKKSRTAARKSKGSKKRGGMFRRAAKTAFDGIVGKTPIDKLDKAKQVADAVAKGIATGVQSTPVTQGMTRTFSTPTERMRIEETNITDGSPNENAYKTPVKGSDRSDGSKLSKVGRHYSRSVITPESYAPTIYEPRSIVTGNLFD